MKLHKAWPPKKMPPSVASAGWENWSATWEPADAPGLLLAKTRPWRDGRDLPPCWLFDCPPARWSDDTLPDVYGPALRAWEHLEGQRFATRREALQALQALLALERERRA